MKVMHTSDLHIGRVLMEESLLQDQQHILDEIIRVAREEEAEVLMISGDIYDKSIPSAEAVRLFNDFLVKLSQLDCEVLMIRGNHDSADRLNFGSRLFDRLNIHIVSEYDGYISKFSKGNVDFYMLPFIKPFHLKGYLSEEEYAAIRNSNDMMKAILERENLDENKINILMMHRFVKAGDKLPELSDSESQLSVGTLDPVDSSLLERFDYVALGHIHKPQIIIRNTVRYSGTPMKYSFSEANNINGVVTYDTVSGEVKTIELKPLREMRNMKVTYEEAMNMPDSDDLLRIELQDEPQVSSPLDNLKRKFPNLLSLVPLRHQQQSRGLFARRTGISSRDTPETLFAEFFELQEGRGLNDNEEKYFRSILEELREEEA
ncbi:MAG: exonuclease SbcCD subunit D [Erysipelotrichaceae bacterium]|nr:exonuclease SbcCD subunit D [Erysipelotrichaceae bacterium]